MHATYARRQGSVMSCDCLVYDAEDVSLVQKKMIKLSSGRIIEELRSERWAPCSDSVFGTR